MVLKNKMKDRTTLIRLGMFFLILALLSLQLPHSTRYLSEGAMDFFRGCLFGLSIAFNLMAVRVGCACRNSEAPTV